MLPSAARNGLKRAGMSPVTVAADIRATKDPERPAKAEKAGPAPEEARKMVEAAREGGMPFTLDVSRDVVMGHAFIQIWPSRFFMPLGFGLLVVAALLAWIPKAIGFVALIRVLAVVFACSTPLLSPVGYQTNLMVYGPGGYRFSDFLRVGVPMNILIGVTTVTVLLLGWPLTR